MQCWQKLSSSMQIPENWQHQNNSLVRTFSFSDFKEAMAFLVQVAFLAEAQNHHPEIFNVYNKVTLTLRTHDAGNIVTAKDVALAESVNEGIR
jgi:4a-hydroxytetrahydrobiopterin dehydratase